MNILRVITTMNPEHGGPSQGIRNMVPALQEIGVYNEVVCFDDPDSSYLSSSAFTIYALGNGKGPYSYNGKLSSWLKNNFHRFDVVVIHGLWQYNSYGTYKAWKKYKKTNSTYPKLYVMPHGMLDPYFQKAPERRIKALRNTIFYALFEGKVVNGCNGVLFTCQQELELAREPFSPYKPQSELNIGYGIQPPPAYNSELMDEAFYKTCPDLKQGTPYMVFLSRIHQKKGVDLLIKAYLDLKENNNIPDLVIAGPGLDTDYGKQLQDLASRSKKIHFPGMLKSEAKWGAFYNSEAFVLPSHQENFGIAIVEAMACSKAVLITDKVNIWQEIKNGDGGIVVNDDFDGVKSALVKWLSFTNEERRKKGERAYEVYTSFFSVKTAALRFKTIFENNING